MAEAIARVSHLEGKIQTMSPEEATFIYEMDLYYQTWKMMQDFEEF